MKTILVIACLVAIAYPLALPAFFESLGRSLSNAQYTTDDTEQLYGPSPDAKAFQKRWARFSNGTGPLQTGGRGVPAPSGSAPTGTGSLVVPTGFPRAYPTANVSQAANHQLRKRTSSPVIRPYQQAAMKMAAAALQMAA